MKIHEVIELYDGAYAASYDARFLLLPWGRQASAFELTLIREQLGEQGSYLDVACGTGWFLSQLPGHDRAGLDISPSMLDKARTVNPDAHLRHGDFLADQPDWHDRWDLVSCMWFAYCYVETVAEVERLIANMAQWTSPTGAVFLPVCDFAALGLEHFPYQSAAKEFGGVMSFTSITWTWTEPGSDKVHQNLVAPHEDHLIAVFSRHFLEVEIHHYPRVLLDADSEQPWVWSRKAILAKTKREADDTTASRLAIFPSPSGPDVQDTDSTGPPKPGPSPPAEPGTELDGQETPHQSASTMQRPMDSRQRPFWGGLASSMRQGLLRALRAAEQRLGG